MPATRTAHPYDDTDVIDARAPRFNQTVVGTLSLLAVVTGWWILVAALAVQLIAGLRFGRRYCLPCVFYFEVLQPRIGEGEVEDARPPRFANILGAVFLSASSLAYLAGWTGIGTAIAALVAALALLAAVTGFCLGCEMYRFGARLRGIRPGSVERIDLEELGVVPNGRVVVQFTHPLCSDCKEVERRLTEDGERLVLIDVSARADLARRYHVQVVPTALAVEGDGLVVARLV